VKGISSFTKGSRAACDMVVRPLVLQSSVLTNYVILASLATLVGPLHRSRFWMSTTSGRCGCTCLVERQRACGRHVLDQTAFLSVDESPQGAHIGLPTVVPNIE
jgi:hypothetical protein